MNHPPKPAVTLGHEYINLKQWQKVNTVDTYKMEM